MKTQTTNTPAHTSDPDCIFCKIVDGKIPCHKLYEDDQVLAFLDIGPLSRGHSLVIPKDHHITLDQVPDKLAGHCFAVVTRLARAVTKATGTCQWNVLQNNGTAAGQVVGHVHIHIIPRQANDGLGFIWNAGNLDNQEAQKLVNDITKAMG